MNCAFCFNSLRTNNFTKLPNIYYSSTPRFICYCCIGYRDKLTMRQNKPITLYILKNKSIKLVNKVNTLQFKILKQVIKKNKIIYYFQFENSKWQGIKWDGCDRVICSKCTERK